MQLCSSNDLVQRSLDIIGIERQHRDLYKQYYYYYHYYCNNYLMTYIPVYIKIDIILKNESKRLFSSL